jgi:hypothetical protein
MNPLEDFADALEAAAENRAKARRYAAGLRESQVPSLIATAETFPHLVGERTLRAAYSRFPSDRLRQLIEAKEQHTTHSDDLRK